MIQINDDQVAIFADPHFGKSKDNVIKLNTAQQYISYFIDLMKGKTKTVICLGDWFDNRNSLNINTNHIGYSCLKQLAQVFHVYVIVGNHDTYYKNTTQVNSLIHFDEIDNITIIETPTEVDMNGKYGLMCPWHFDLNQYKEKKYDYLFGHFNMSGAALVGTVYTDGPYTVEDLTKMAPIVFSGHFHIRKDYPFKDGKVITVGCPFELDWGDHNNEKGTYMLYTKTGEYKFIPNTTSPVHKKLYWNELVTNGFKIDSTIIKGNYIKLVIDGEYNYDKVVKVIEEINTHTPIIKTEPEFIFNTQKNMLQDLKFSKTDVEVSVPTYIDKFIDKMKTPPTIDKTILKGYIDEYYNKVS